MAGDTLMKPPKWLVKVPVTNASMVCRGKGEDVVER
jgi:hypothetical protein